MLLACHFVVCEQMESIPSRLCTVSWVLCTVIVYSWVLLDMNHDSPTDNDHDMDYHCDFMGELVHIVLAHLLQLLILKYVNCVV